MCVVQDVKSEPHSIANHPMTTSIYSAHTIQVPDLNADSINMSEGLKSYKIDFSDISSWYASEDGGISKYAIGSARICGAMVDLTLESSPARNRDGTNQRLRLALRDLDGQRVELNLNTVGQDASGALYTSSPARSLCGALLCISESEEDMRAACQAARFTIQPGRGRGVFITMDIASCGSWVAMSGPMATMRVPRQPELFQRQLEQIKSRFRAVGLLLPTPALQSLELAEI
jgi:hypothetical protein